MKKKLCTPCAAGLRVAGNKLKKLPGKSVKITCGGCGRRRFGVEYEILKGADRNGDV